MSGNWLNVSTPLFTCMYMYIPRNERLFKYFVSEAQLSYDITFAVWTMRINMYNYIPRNERSFKISCE